MNDGKVLTYLGIIIAINTAFWTTIQTSWLWFFGINITTICACLLLSHIEKKLLYSNHKWIDGIVYRFTKNDFNYVVKQKIVNYIIESEHSAKYSLSAEICVRHFENDFHYNGRYVWDQEDDINVILHDPSKFQCITSENLKWSNVDIYPKSSIAKPKTNYSVGFDLDNLAIRKLIKHSFLSCKVVEKIEHLQLVAYVEPSLHPAKKATLEIQNHLGMKIADDEEIPYNEATHSYSTTLSYPRKGRKYTIHWKYEKSN